MRFLKEFMRWFLSLFMMGAGAMHFVQPKPFEKLVPSFFRSPRDLVYLSGFFEILGGIGLLIGGVRKIAAWGLILLYIAVFPANLKMALRKIPFGSFRPHPLLLWLRLPFQLVFIAWAYWFTK